MVMEGRFGAVLPLSAGSPLPHYQRGPGCSQSPEATTLLGTNPPYDELGRSFSSYYLLFASGPYLGHTEQVLVDDRFQILIPAQEGPELGGG